MRPEAAIRRSAPTRSSSAISCCRSQIGAYSFEHGHTQKVRFDVAADVLRVTAAPEDMRHVFSYDVIMDGIRAIVGARPCQLSEALAEKVAHMCSRIRV